MGLISQTKQIIGWGFKFAAITAFNSWPSLVCWCFVFGRSEKGLRTSLHLSFLFRPVHLSNWPFLCHYTQRSILSHQITSAEWHSEEWRAKIKFFFLFTKTFTLVEKSFVSLSFVSGLVTHCSEQAGKKEKKKTVQQRQHKALTLHRSPPFSLLHQSHRIWGSACCSIQANLPWILSAS